MRFNKYKMMSCIEPERLPYVVMLSWVHEFDGREVAPINDEWYQFVPSEDNTDLASCQYYRVHRDWVTESDHV